MYIKNYHPQLIEYRSLVSDIKEFGERFPKKHGDWYRAIMAGQYILYDTWNGQIYFYGEKCEPSGKDIYGGVVTFYGNKNFLCSQEKASLTFMEKLRPYFHLVGSY